MAISGIPRSLFGDSSGGGVGGSVGATAIVYRGAAQGSTMQVQGFNGGTIRARTTRARKRANEAFRYYRVVIPLWYTTGTPRVDVLYTGSQAIMRFQHGLEYPFTDAVTGLAPRFAATFSGNNYVEYDNATWDPATGYILSDLMDFGSTIPAGAFYGEWLTAEMPASGSNIMPYVRNSSNIIQRRTGINESASSQITAYGGATNYALATTSITAAGTGTGGVSNYYMTTMLLVGVSASAKTGFICGDSIAYGVGEGSNVLQYAFGDPMGSAQRSCGYVERWLHDVLGKNFSNVAIGSDRASYIIDTAGGQYRRQYLGVTNPTFAVVQHGFNDMASATASNWAATTAYNQYDVFLAAASNKMYIVTTAGTSGAVSPTGTGTAEVDGTCILRYLGTAASVETRAPYVVVGRMVKLIAQLKAILPNVKIILTCLTPNATSTDSFATTANQTTSTVGWDAGERRALYNTYVLDTNNWAWMGVDAVIDANNGLEDTPASDTGKWVVDGTAFYATNDGGHPNSRGASIGTASLPLLLPV